ncbi:right-handed parallel beta-helix repeat-containing protein [Aliagarivorans marinus]|uniref:right-handed parallel beta-helix repeat-containing protein n=1 Tax=Aliagarivorans marinus TaxID=561965 RepID=UPI0004175C4B|nr:right-handed parallel beta-helix repeat-containing protein [Aliagarivorans marinus]
MFKESRCWLWPLALLVVTTTVNAAEYFVAPQGSDANDGSRTRPWGSVEHAVAQLQAGDYLYLRAGRYPLEQDLVLAQSGAPHAPITLTTLPDEHQQAVLAGAGLAVLGQSHIRIAGLSIEDPSYQTGRGVGIYIEGANDRVVSDVVVEENHIVNSESSGIAVWGVPWGSDPLDYHNIHQVSIKGNRIERAVNGGWNEVITLANGVVDFAVEDNHISEGGDPSKGGEGIDLKEGVRDGRVCGNHIHGIHRRGIYLDGGGGLPGQDFGRKPTVENIDICNNRVHGIRELHDDRGRALFVGAGAMALMTEGTGDIRNIRIYNNLFFDNQEDGILLYDHPGDTGKGSGRIEDVTIFNNTIVGNGRDGLHLNFPRIRELYIGNNILFANRRRALNLYQGRATLSQNLTRDPLFQGEALRAVASGSNSTPMLTAEDFRLHHLSHAKGQGLRIIGKVDTATLPDYFGQSRRHRVDIGAIQAQPLASD